MRVLNCHVHWFPRSVFEDLCERKGSYPRAERNAAGGYDLYATYGRVGVVGYRRTIWFDLDDHIRHIDSTGHETGFICSLGPFSTFFSEIPLADGIHYARMYNDEMAQAQRATRVGYGRAARCRCKTPRPRSMNWTVWSQKLGLIGVNIPGSIGRDNHIDASAPRALLCPHRATRRSAVHPSDRQHLHRPARRIQRRAAPRARPHLRRQHDRDAAHPLGASSSAIRS